MVSPNYIAHKLRELRKSRGMDVDTVGACVGRSGKTVSAWETGRNVPSADMLITICLFFGVDIDYFYPPEVSNTYQNVSESEQKLIALYRAMSAQGRDLLIENAEFLAARHPLNKVDSMGA